MSKFYSWQSTPHNSPSIEMDEDVISRINLVVNPSFEVDTTNIQPFGGTLERVNTESYAGDHSARLTVTEEDPLVGIRLAVTGVSANDTFVFSAKIKPRIDNSLPLLNVRLSFRDVAANQIYQTVMVAVVPMFDGWYHVSTPHTVPSARSLTEVLITPELPEDLKWSVLKSYAWTDTPNASPSTETVDGVLTRTNLMPRPVPTGSGGWASNSGSRYAGSLAVGEGREGRNAQVFARTADSPSASIASAYAIGGSSSSAAGGAPVEAGKTYTLSVYVRTEREGAWRAQWNAAFADSGLAVIVNETTGWVEYSGTGWQRLTLTVVAPAGAVWLRPALNVATTSGNASEGERVWLCDAQIEEVEPDTTYAWTGTPNASPSTETIDGVVTRTNRLLNPRPGSLDRYGASRMTATLETEGGSSFARGVVTEAGSSSSARFGTSDTTPVSPGETVTVAADLRSTLSIRVVLLWYNENIYMSTVTGTATAGTGQWERVSVTGTAPAGASGYRLYVGANVGPTTLGDVIDFRHVSDAPGTYFDGDTQDVPDQVEPTEFFYGDTPLQLADQFYFDSLYLGPKGTYFDGDFPDILDPPVIATEWDRQGERYYETGIDRGVLYIDNGPPIPWSGLTAVNETDGGAEYRPIYMDGLKVHTEVSNDEYSATVHAYAYPREFEVCVGNHEFSVFSPLIVPGQSRKPFDFCYRTRKGNDIDGTDFGYKLHLVYNATAMSSEKNYATISDETELAEFAWEISTVPPRVPGFRPTGHLIIDMQMATPEIRDHIEHILYGTQYEEGRMPSVEEIQDIISQMFILTITDHGDGTWTAEASDTVVSLLQPTVFQINYPTAIMIDDVSYEVSSG